MAPQDPGDGPRRTRMRAIGGTTAALVAVVLVTGTLAGAVVAVPAIAVELSDGDACETRETGDADATVTVGNVTSYAATVTQCVVGGEEEPHDRETGSALPTRPSQSDG